MGLAQGLRTGRSDAFQAGIRKIVSVSRAAIAGGVALPLFIMFGLFGSNQVAKLDCPSPHRDMTYHGNAERLLGL